LIEHNLNHLLQRIVTAIREIWAPTWATHWEVREMSHQDFMREELGANQRRYGDFDPAWGAGSFMVGALTYSNAAAPAQ
jgi:demethoxyubiquinone hydroxylase (CLK1/Coq7/Cat5 family)